MEGVGMEAGLGSLPFVVHIITMKRLTSGFFIGLISRVCVWIAPAGATRSKALYRMPHYNRYDR